MPQAELDFRRWGDLQAWGLVDDWGSRSDATLDEALLPLPEELRRHRRQG